jgi:tRNA U34 5-methylaminomethyl-2-thiouridine-forming methyltransferase MnmC
MSRLPTAIALATPFLFLFPSTIANGQVTVVIKSGPDTNVTQRPFQGSRAAVDVALLLDTSNSMDGLISQAKNQLWTIVQEFAAAQRSGQTPLLRVALFEYGNTGLPASEGYIRQVVQLTDDLDELSEALFGLRTNGGDEYCGQVIDEALKRLDWAHEPNSYKAIFIAGNEPFTQGSVDYRQACRSAIEHGVIVNTIHCGNYESGIGGKWKNGADLAEGEYFNIDQDEKLIHIDCPQDKIILRLNAELNKTYLWFGGREERARRGARQIAQDANAASEAPSTAVNRVVAKAGSAYNHASRDLVDGVRENRQLLSAISNEQLPEAMQSMDLTERQAYLEKMSAQRQTLQQQIAKLNTQRNAYIAKQRAMSADAHNPATLGDVMAGAVRKQLVNAGFTMEEK